jgi:hypothetical protein
MPWFHFTDDFRWKIRPGAYTQYRAGMETSITTACAEAAKALGLGYVMDKPEGVRLEKSGRVIEPETTQVFIHEEEQAEEEIADGEGSQPYPA